jgi:hypothetical protein
MKTFLAIVCIFLAIGSRNAWAHEFKDDYGDEPKNARMIGCGSNVNGSIEIDVDQDWFAFTARSLKQYTIRVFTNSLWDANLTLLAPDRILRIARSDSVASPFASVSWFHVGPPTVYYVGVGGFAEFATGTYKIVVWENAFKDADNDGMKDDWEIRYWGGTNQAPAGDYDGDSTSNLDEFRMGTDPTNFQSHLMIDSILYSNTTVMLACQVQPHRYYRIGISSNTGGQGWVDGDVITNLYTRGLRTFMISNLPPDQLRFFRILCIY